MKKSLTKWEASSTMMEVPKLKTDLLDDNLNTEASRGISVVYTDMDEIHITTGNILTSQMSEN